MSDGAQHVPVLLEETIAALAVRPTGTYVDCTFGRGGHSRAILARLGGAGRLIALDRDPAAVREGSRIVDGRFRLVHACFSELGEVLAASGISHADGIVLDLGVSSPQIDDPARGFSFRSSGPLDMRMDPTRGRSAAQWIAAAPEREIAEVIRRYGEERFAKQIAAAIVAVRARDPIATTQQLAAIVTDAVRTREPGQDPATRSFQAIRIHVNQELEELSVTLPKSVQALAPGGRLAVISFHSLEDRIVKRFMRTESQADRMPLGLPVRARDLPVPRLKLVGKPQRPGARELAANPRARSATLRVAERTHG